MNKNSGTSKDAADKLVKGIRRKTRKQYSAEETDGKKGTILFTGASAGVCLTSAPTGQL